MLERTDEASAELRNPSRIERLAFVALVPISVSLTHFSGNADSTESAPVAEILWGLAYIAALFGFLRDRRYVLLLAKRSVPLLLILGLVLASAAWSEEPSTTFRRAVGLCGTTVIAFYLVSRYSLRAFVETLIVALSVTAVASLILIAVAPSDGIDPMGGIAFRGIFFQKNGLGVTMALAVASMVAALPSMRGRRRSAVIVSLVLCSFLLLGSQSGTGIVTLGVLLFAYFLLLPLRIKAARAPAIFAVFALTVVIACGYAGGLSLDDALGTIGKDTTLTGRTDVWTIATQHIAEKPLLGFGYRVFWDPMGPVHAYLLKDIGWEPDSSHNGYLEVVLNVGFIGAIFFAIFLLQGVARAYGFFVRNGPGLCAWPLVAVLYQLISNFTETSLAMYNTIGWVVLVAATLYSTERTTIENRQAQPTNVDALMTPRLQGA